MKTATNTKANKPKERVELVPVTDADHQQVVEMIRGRTMEMSFTVHGLPKSRRIKGKQADQVAASVDGKRKGIRSSWSMFSSDHPAVKELNAMIRDLNILRDRWTIVRSATVSKGDGDKVSIEGGKRLIWDADIEEFHSLFTDAAKRIDIAAERLQFAMNNATRDGEGNYIKSVKEMDKENAGTVWEDEAYPVDLTFDVGVAKERDSNNETILDANGKPKYLIKFEEYHVSEKLPEMLRERALRRIDEGLSGTIETAMQYATSELADSMLTLLGELSNRTKVFPKTDGEYGYLHEAEVIKLSTHEDDSRLKNGEVKIYLRYKQNDDGSEQRISKWFGPMPLAEYTTKFKPRTTSDKKKIFPTVIESIIEQMEAFKDKKSPYAWRIREQYQRSV